jgi:hypothetical protein
MARAPLGCLLLIVAVIGSCSVPYILHNRALSHVAADYARITHPKSSSAVEGFSKLGIAAGGDGNHCDYLVGEIRESDDPPERITAHYSRFSFPPLDAHSGQWAPREAIRASVEFPDSPDDTVLRWDIPDALAQARAKKRKYTLYVVYLLDGGYDPNGDWRCH